jgi:hypothetical protein
MRTLRGSILTMALVAESVVGVAGQDQEQAAASMTAQQLDDAIIEAWNQDDVPRLLQLYHPDAVHQVNYYGGFEVFEGQGDISSVALGPVLITGTAPVIELVAPDGELRWLEFVDVTSPNLHGEGTICVFRAVAGQVVRQDCMIPLVYGDA